MPGGGGGGFHFYELALGMLLAGGVAYLVYWRYNSSLERALTRKQKGEAIQVGCQQLQPGMQLRCGNHAPITRGLMTSLNGPCWPCHHAMGLGKEARKGGSLFQLSSAVGVYLLHERDLGTDKCLGAPVSMRICYARCGKRVRDDTREHACVADRRGFGVACAGAAGHGYRHTAAPAGQRQPALLGELPRWASPTALHMRRVMPCVACSLRRASSGAASI